MVINWKKNPHLKSDRLESWLERFHWICGQKEGVQMNSVFFALIFPRWISSGSVELWSLLSAASSQNKSLCGYERTPPPPTKTCVSQTPTRRTSWTSLAFCWKACVMLNSWPFILPVILSLVSTLLHHPTPIKSALPQCLLSMLQFQTMNPFAQWWQSAGQSKGSLNF